jgi:hypothetical protein
LFDATTGEVSALNQTLNSAPDGLIAPYWDDLDSVTGLGNVYWQILGTAPQRRVVIMWSERLHAGGSFGMVTFEMILHENGNLEFQYQQTDFGEQSVDNGASATIGVRGIGSAQRNASVLQHTLRECWTGVVLHARNVPCDATDDPWWSVSQSSHRT